MFLYILLFNERVKDSRQFQLVPCDQFFIVSKARNTVLSIGMDFSQWAT